MNFRVKFNILTSGMDGQVVVKNAASVIEALQRAADHLNIDPARVESANAMRMADEIYADMPEVVEKQPAIGLKSKPPAKDCVGPTEDEKPKKKRGRPKKEKVTKETDPVEVAQEAGKEAEASGAPHTPEEVQAIVAKDVSEAKISLDSLMKECEAAGITNASEIKNLTAEDANLFLVNLRARENG